MEFNFAHKRGGMVLPDRIAVEARSLKDAMDKLAARTDLVRFGDQIVCQDGAFVRGPGDECWFEVPVG